VTDTGGSASADAAADTSAEAALGTSADAALEAHLDAEHERRMASYGAFLRIPSISGISDHHPDCRAAAAFLADDLRSIGIEHVEVSETGGLPIVYGDWLRAPGAPTVIVYGHYDVQPVDPLDLWDSPPFEPVVRDGRMLARGAADDKGQVHMHVRAAEAVLVTRGRLPINLRFVFEGEEESTSPNFAPWLEANRDRLGADVVVISDTPFFAGNLPAITLGLRGVVHGEIDVDGPSVDLHSGSYGGAVDNPINALAAIIAALKGPDGRVRVPGFYDDVVPLGEADRASFAALPFDDAAFLASTGAPALFGEAGYTTLERRGARPTLDINGIWGGFQGEGTKTIIPAHAHAKISCRLVADQDPHRIFEALRAFIAEVAPPGVRAAVTLLGTGRPSLLPIDHPVTRAAARAVERAFGRAPLFVREGGSIMAAADFGSVLGLPVVLAGFTNPDDHAHSPNESMVLDNYERGIRAIAFLWDELAAGIEA
jgi:acetylornithine deacetylase/succinyl-diaminopimelate desuccinylase-like protein